MKTFASLLLTAALAAAGTAPARTPQDPPRSGPGRQGQPPAEPMLLPQAVVFHRAGRELAIDGSLVDWPELPALVLGDPRQLSGTAGDAWRGVNDLGAVAFLMWDETHCWFAATVKDEWHRALDAESLQLSEIPIADSVVLTFDANRDTRALGPDPGRVEDREFWLAEEEGHEVVHWDRMRGTAKVLPGDAARMVVSHDKEHGITTYEARIPWSEILPPGRKPEAGLVLDAQIVVSDFDETTDSMPQTRVGWTFGCSGAVIDPGLFGSLMLVKDAAALAGQVPEFPPKPAAAKSPLGTEDDWRALSVSLSRTQPAIHDGSGPPEHAGGTERAKVLEEIDAHCERFPRVDHMEFLHRIHRRMVREVAGISARGLPWWWQERLRAVSKGGEARVPNGTARLFRLPQGGYVVRFGDAGFCIDPAGANLPEWIWGACDFAVLTQPLDLARRNDQLLVRLLRSKPPRPFLAHAAFHLPQVLMADMPVVEPGKSYPQANGVEVDVLCRRNADGSVPSSCSYRLALPGGPTLIVAAASLLPDEVPKGRCDALVLSPRNPRALDVAALANPAVIVIDDTFLCASDPRRPRIPLRTLHEFQRALSPQRSVVLAPGESWDVAAGTAK